ncbi:dipeptidyl-peptidase 5 [Alteriqipengyuania lutimaris]|uniref:S9 family peptidase n=1 Tax=Alteriqipengyuania lutimaris TaxID=1538146 RepID=A0A395LJ16_9SPHN|nr:S9 family peptidase [Alteriqipengyuania lutimaris]MBB3034457.1 dipeptidyl aminopeptidase/acylaminoacyl peptidase [Alteriqipengyuania lutimaris]RDS76649.1 S9 family peptidase [Alteriqipengyuania lutimaris]
MRKALQPLALLAASAAFFTTPATAQDAVSQDSGQTARPMTARDLVTMPRLGGPSVNASGELALYSVTQTDQEALTRSTTYRVKTLDTGEDVVLTLPEGASSPVFVDDERIFFLAPGGRNSEGMQVFSGHYLGDGRLAQVTQVTRLNNTVGGFKVSPDGQALAIFGNVPRECTSFDCAQATPTYAPGPGSGMLFDAADGFVRHWDTYETPGTFSRVFVYPIEDGLVRGAGTAADGPAGEGALVGDTPLQPFGGLEDMAWGADGETLYFVARQADSDEPTSTNTDIYRFAMVDTGPVNLTDSNEASDGTPAPSPDGQSLAYLAMERPGYESDRQRIMLRDLATGQTRALTEDFDRSFGSLAWTPDSRWIIATAQDVLDTPAFRIDPRDGTVTQLNLITGDEAHIGNVTPAGETRLLFTRDSIAAPAELYVSENWNQATRLTDVAASRMATLAPVQTRRFEFEGADGDTVWGQITKPSDAARELPAILYVHGGPQGSFNDGWSSRWNPRVLASQGYAVISVDFHGSTGYGQDFTDAINRDWGGKPLEDLQKGLAAALALDPQIDGDRACAMGASYGGYMMNWIAGNWPDRFDCLVQHDGLFDMRSFYYATEELWFPRWDFGGSYSEARDTYERWNPVNYVDNWQTPMLVITGEKDYRVPYTQGLQSFTALQERGIPSQLLVFPDENHWVLKPKNSLQWHDTIFAWLDRWLAEDAE